MAVVCFNGLLVDLVAYLLLAPDDARQVFYYQEDLLLFVFALDSQGFELKLEILAVLIHVQVFDLLFNQVEVGSWAKGVNFRL